MSNISSLHRTHMEIFNGYYNKTRKIMTITGKSQSTFEGWKRLELYWRNRNLDVQNNLVVHKRK